MDNGYTPSTVGVDAPIEIDQGQGGGVWRPENYSSGKYQGPVTLRNALRQSLNTVTVRLGQGIGMPLGGEYANAVALRNGLSASLNTVTVRLAQDIGMPLIGEYAKRFGVYDELPNYLSYALGAGGTTVMRMA